MVKEFVEYVTRLQNDLLSLVPEEIKKAMAVIKGRLGACTGLADSSHAKIFRQYNYLKSFITLNVFGFNSGKMF